MRNDFYKLETIREQFPVFQKNSAISPPVFFDGPGGTQMSLSCLQAMTDYISSGMANLHGHFSTSRQTEAILWRAREAVGDWLHCSSGEVAFGQNMTSLAFQVAGGLEHLISPGDRILVTELDHRANVDPWIQLAHRKGAKVDFLPVDRKNFILDLSNLDQLLTSRTKLMAVGISSNLTGTINPVKDLFAMAKKVGAITIADAVHAVPHIPIDFQELGCDILFCSAYKFFGPHLGISVIRKDLFEKIRPSKLLPAPKEIPFKLETGTQNHEAIAGLCGTLDFLASFGVGQTRQNQLRSSMEQIEGYEQKLMHDLLDFLKSLPEAKVFRAPANIPTTPTVSFQLSGISAGTAAEFLAREHTICVGNGHFYASTMADIFNVMPQGGWIRVGLAPYNTSEEVQRFKEGVLHLLKELKIR